MNRFLGRPQLLAIAIALVIAAPVLIIGQASEDETRARLQAEQRANAERTAEVVSTNLADRLTAVRASLVSLGLGNYPEDSPVGLAAERGDVAALQSIVDSVQRQYPRYVLHVYVATRGQAASINDGKIVAVAPPSDELVGKRLNDLSGPSGAAVRQWVGLLATLDTGALSDVFPGSPSAPSREVIVVTTIPRSANPLNGSGLTFLAATTATIVAELDFAATFEDAVRSSLAPGDDAYILDNKRNVIGRARGRLDFPLVDLSADPFVALIGPSTPVVSRLGASDPLGAGARLIASAPFAGVSGSQSASISLSSYSVLLIRDTASLDQEVNSALGQLALFRLLVVGMLLGLAYLAGLSASHLTLRAVDGERLRLARDLHDLLGHSLSLIAIKTQLARRLLKTGDITSASSEIADIERVTRDSLGDVRNAVDGYRQPTFRSALAGARAALSAAGIESTVEQAPGPLPVALDAALAWAVREGVTNVIRHSHAAACDIRLTRDGREAHLEITDNGEPVGLGIPGNGLRGLQERIAARGGRTDAGPLPDGGFRLRITLPLGSS